MPSISDYSKLTQIPVDELSHGADLLRRFVAATGLTIGVAAKALMTAPQNGAIDGRFTKWNARVLIFGGSKGDLLADSDAGLDAWQHGCEVCDGLTAVAAYAADLVCSFHDKFVEPALVRAMFMDKVGTLRVSLSRAQGGGAPWRVNYRARDTEYTCRVQVHPYAENVGGDTGRAYLFGDTTAPHMGTWRSNT